MKIRATALLVLLGMAFYAAWTGVLCSTQYRYFHYNDFDLAVHAQSVANIVKGSGDCSLLGIPFLGNHLVLILYLIAPVYALFPTAETLLWIQSLFLATGAWAVFLLGRDVLRPAVAAGLAFVYLLHPALLSMNLFEFHPVALATPLLLFACVAYQQQRPVAFALAAGLAMACQENIPLIITMFSVLAWIDRRSMAWRTLPVVAGALWFVAAVAFIMPRLNPHAIQFSLLYAHLGDTPGEAIRNMVTHPISTLMMAFAPAKLGFLATLLLPTAFVGLAAPRALIPLLPILAQRLLSGRESESSILYHYQAEFLPFVFAAAVPGLKRINDWYARRSPSPLPLFVLGIATLLSFTSAGGSYRWIAPLANRDAADRQSCEAVVAALPSIQPVAASFRFLPQLVNNPRLHSLHHLYTGRYTLSTTAYPIPSDLAAIAYDAVDRVFTDPGFAGPYHPSHLRHIVSDGEWRVSYLLETHVVADRKESRGFSISELTLENPDRSTWMLPVGCPPTVRGLNLEGCSMSCVSGAPQATVDFYWNRASSTAAIPDIELVVTLRDGQATADYELVPGHRLWPSSQWLTNTWIRDRQVLQLPAGFDASGSLSIEALMVPSRVPPP